MNFTGKAILCETWEQMEHLAKIAEGMGITAQPDQYNEDNFVAGARYFALYTQKTYCNAGDVEPNETETTFTQFINQSDTPSVYGSKTK